MEMKEVLCREGRDAKNLLLYQFCDEKPGAANNNCDKTLPPAFRKPPKSPNALVVPQAAKKTTCATRHGIKQSTGPRVRSASTGRDKKSELQARYWALLFGNLQRAVNEIYQTVECYENISSCQEAILVLENYVRDFKALSEWFKVSWDYESRPLQQRPHSLAWEVRKSNPVPRVRAKSLSSPTASGKSSPCLCPCNSGKSSPCCNAGGLMDSLSPRKSLRVNVRELFSSSKRQVSEQQRPELDLSREKQQIKEGETRCHQYAQTDLEDDHLTLADIREKMRREEEEKVAATAAAAAAAVEAELCSKEEERIQREEVGEPNCVPSGKEEFLMCETFLKEHEPTAVELTVRKLNAMEDALLIKDAAKISNPLAAELKEVGPAEPSITALKASNASVPQDGMQNSPLKYSSVLNRPATATAAAGAAAVIATVAAVPARPTATKTLTLRPSSTAMSANVRSTNVGSKSTISSNSSLRRTATAASVTTKSFASARSGARNSSNMQPQLATRTSGKIDGFCPPSNVAARLSSRSRTMIEMNNNTTPPKSTFARRPLATSRALGNTSSSRKASQEDTAPSNSTLKTSNERISLSRPSVSQGLTPSSEERRSEPKQPISADANDGWLTVKNRRRSSMHWTNRFNQPTGYASLPTLSLLDEKELPSEKELPQNEKLVNGPSTSSHSSMASKQVKPMKAQKAAEKTAKVALRPEIKNAKAKVNSLPTQRRNSTTSTTHPKRESATAAAVPSRQTIIKRQKSDLTGLKMTSLHKEYMRSEKLAQRKQNNTTSTKNSLLTGSVKMLSNGQLASGDTSDINSSAETIIEANNSPFHTQSLDPEVLNPELAGDQNKIDIKIQTNRDFSKTIGDLYESISSMARITSLASLTNETGAAATLSICDENDETMATDAECDEHQRMLVEEQESLERQIRELESSEIDVDTETDETDCEVGVLEHDPEEEGCGADDVDIGDASSVVFVPVNEDSEDANLSLEMRYQALLSEMSWGEREEALATLQAYVSRHPGRAQELHQKLSSPSRRRSLQETLKKYQIKQARAQQKRELLQKEKAIKIQQLLTRVEDVKAAKRQLIEDKRLKMEGRLQRAAENREQYLRQIIEKAHDEEKKLKEINFIKNIEAQNKRLDLIESSKETEGRLQDLEQERQKRLEEKAAKEAAVERRRQELEKERQRKLEKMNETRLEKEQRIGKMQEQKERQRQALAREKARDREERLLALQVQQQQTTEELQRKILQKQKESARRHEENIEHIRQRALELTIPSRNVEENGHQRLEIDEDPPEDGDLSSTVSDVGSREHTRSYKKKMKKLKQRMAQGVEEYMKDLQPVPLHMKRESQVPKYLNLVNKGGGAQGMERALGHLLRLMAKAQVFDFQCFLLMDGLGAITHKVITKGMEEDSEVSKKAVVLAVQLYRNACTLCPQIARHAILGNSLIALFDALFQSLQLPEEKSPQHPVELSTELMLACTVALSPSYTKKHTHPKVLERLPDLISYAVITGLVEILSRRCMKIRESIENHQSVVLSLLATLGFITRFIDVCPPGPADSTRFLSAAKSTELFGSISMLYASVVPIGECIPPRTVSLAAATFNLLVSMAVLDLATFQEVMSSEAICLKFLDVVTILLKYCGSKCSASQNSETQAVIIDLIATIGFFCANNKKNQDLLTSEQCSIIIKNLTKLPEHLNVVVYPCLVTITFQNPVARDVISRDFNLEFLDEYSKSEKAKKNHLVALLKEKT